MKSIFVLVVVIAAFTVAASVKEWKNFENGKVYSHKTPTDKKETKTHVSKSLDTEEHILHSHHKEKKIHHQMKAKKFQTTNNKDTKSKNAERHHKKTVEEEMHLKPLNERHHKFPNPALLTNNDPSNPPSPQITKQNLMKQTKGGRLNNRRRLRERRYQRNKFNQNQQPNDDSFITSQYQEMKINDGNAVEKPQNKMPPTQQILIKNVHNGEANDKYPSKLPSYW